MTDPFSLLLEIAKETDEKTFKNKLYNWNVEYTRTRFDDNSKFPTFQGMTGFDIPLCTDDDDKLYLIVYASYKEKEKKISLSLVKISNQADAINFKFLTMYLHERFEKNIDEN